MAENVPEAPGPSPERSGSGEFSCPRKGPPTTRPTPQRTATPRSKKGHLSRNVTLLQEGLHLHSTSSGEFCTRHSTCPPKTPCPHVAVGIRKVSAGAPGTETSSLHPQKGPAWKVMVLGSWGPASSQSWFQLPLQQEYSGQSGEERPGCLFRAPSTPRGLFPWVWALSLGQLLAAACLRLHSQAWSPVSPRGPCQSNGKEPG